MAEDCSLFQSVHTVSGAHLLVNVIADHVHGGKETGCVKLNFHLPSIIDVKNEWSYLSTLHTPTWPVEREFYSLTVTQFSALFLPPECLKILKAYY